MVFHKCLFCKDELKSKETMLTRRMGPIDGSSPHMLRSKRKPENSDSSKDKKTMFSKKQPHPVTKNPARKGTVSVNAPKPENTRKRKRNIEAATINKELQLINKVKKVKVSPNNQKEKLKVSQKNQKDKTKTFCWICHKPCQTHLCACLRVYHPECLVKVSKEFNENLCPECQLKSVDGSDLTRPFSEELKVYLKCVVDWITEKNKLGIFMNWPQNPDENKIVPAIDIQTLTEKVQNNAYKRTSDFYSDTKWIHHNTCILYGEKSKEAQESKKLIKYIKEELIDMEACPECYYHLYCESPNDSEEFDEDPDTNKNSRFEKSFVRLCNPPHDIVWAKVSGYSHWPAKCMKVVNARAHVRFFGKHEKSAIPIDTVFHISKEHPVYDYRNITDTDNRTSLEYTYAKREFLRYKALYENNVGEFRFFKFREFYNPETNNFQIGKNFKHQKEIARQRSQLEFPSSTSSTSVPCIVETTTVPDTDPGIFHPGTFSNDISVNMTFSVDGCRANENANNGDTTWASHTSPSIFSEQSLSNSLNSSSISTGALSEIQIKEELIDSVQTQHFPSDTQTQILSDTERQFSTVTEPSSGSSNPLIQIVMNAISNPSTSMDLASMLRNCISPTSTHETYFPAMPLPNTFQIKKESNLCPTDSASSPSQVYEHKEGNSAHVIECPSDSNSSPSQMHELKEGNPASLTECPSDNVSSPSQMYVPKEGNDSANGSEYPADSVSSPSQVHEFKERNSSNISECASVLADNEQHISDCEALPSSTNKVIAVIDLTSDDNDNDTSNTALLTMLKGNPQMCHLFVNAHQTLQTLLTRLCVETCKQQRADSQRRCEAFSNKLNETQRRFQAETDKLRDEIKCLEMSLDSEKKKNTQS